MGAEMPASLQRSNQNQVVKQKNVSSFQDVDVRLSLVKFKDGPPVSIWFAASHTANSKLTQYYLSFPDDKRQYNQDVKNWSFDFCLYEQFVNQLQSTDFSFVNLSDGALPKFLIEGIKWYTMNINKHRSRLLVADAAAGKGKG
jgi:hypothetical protein